MSDAWQSAPTAQSADAATAACQPTTARITAASIPTTATFNWHRFYRALYTKLDLDEYLPRVLAELNATPTERHTMIAFIKKYAKAIVAGIGYVASIATALGLQHQHYVAVILGVLSTIAVILTKNTAADAAGKPVTR